ncbi:unnamed protein product, partial [Ixodes pacificus]
TGLGAVASSGSAVRCKQEKAAPAPLSAGLGRAGPCCRHWQQHRRSSATLALVRPAAFVPRRARANGGGVFFCAAKRRSARHPTRPSGVLRRWKTTFSRRRGPRMSTSPTWPG